MGRVEGKVAVVTGGSRGLGQEICRLLAKEGAGVAVTDILDIEGEKTVEEIVNSGGVARYYHLNVTQEEGVKEALSAIFKDFQKINILINNAGISGPLKPTHEIGEGEWYQVLDVDAKGVFLCTKHTIPYMKAGGGGSIINISSVYGIVAGIDDPPPYLYHAAKGAVRVMTKSDAVCYARDKIRVNSVHPGWIWTPMLGEVSRKFPGGPAEFNKQFFERIPLGHWGEPADVAYGVLFLASDESKFITGSEMVIDGGYVAW
jgi:NAD(P)-dependent dehydrogenase (short-subunit alcohol dehydrogenase family)